MRIGIVTISTSMAVGERTEDSSGDAIAATFRGEPLHAEVVRRAVIADDHVAIAAILRDWADSAALDVILTTGGTGFAPTDVTPEATLAVAEKVAPGLAEAMRAGTATASPLAWLSRAVAVIRRSTLIINLPGSPRGVAECLTVLTPLLPHAVDILTQTVRQHPPQSAM